MAVIPCPNQVDCPGSDFPISNYSSEGPEQTPQFFSLYFPQAWDRFGCLSLCVSDVSQEAADLCAIAQEALCGTTPPRFCSEAATCTCESFGGSEFFYTTPPSTFCADTQEAANALANAYACARCGGSRTSTQIIGLDACACLGVPYSSQIAYQGARPVAWLITSGSLPDGLTLNSITGLVSGTPTSTGTVSFTIRAFIQDGNYAVRTMSIAVIAITTSAIDPYSVGVAYSFQMQAAGGSGAYVWKINSGSFPTGLIMSVAGLITGTPTESGINPLVFQVNDTACANSPSDDGCTKSLSMDAIDPCGPLPAVSLIGYYKCDDVAFPYVDSLAGKDMTAVAGSAFPTVEPGIINTGFFNLSGVSSGSWGRNTDAQWELSGESAFTLRAWFWYSGTSSTLFDTRVNSAGARYALVMFSSTLGPYFYFQVRGSISYTHRHFAPIGAIGWHRVIGIFRQNCGTYFKVDNNPTTFFADPIGLFTGSTFFEIQLPNTGLPYPKTGVDEVGVWRGAWSEAQMLHDWNGGAGRSYPDVPI